MLPYVVGSLLVIATLTVCAYLTRDRWVDDYHYSFLVLALAFLSYGLYRFLHQGVEISHFSGFGIKQTSATTLVTELSIIGQYKTIGEGFVVGKRISVSALLYLRDTRLYQQFKAYTKEPGVVVVENSEAPEDSKKDISDEIKEGSLGDVFTNPGILRIVKCHDDKQTIVLQGDVVFTREGRMELGMPLRPLLQSHGIQIQGMSIAVAPSYVRHEIYWTRVVTFLTFVTIAVSFLSLFFALRA
jgi:hypothetical protein